MNRSHIINILYSAIIWNYHQPKPAQRETWYAVVINSCIPSSLIADGPDYTGGLLTATFSGSSTAVVPVLILTDNVLDETENFTAVIKVPADTTRDYKVTRGSPDTATVVIIDTTSKLWFSCILSNVQLLKVDHPQG